MQDLKTRKILGAAHMGWFMQIGRAVMEVVEQALQEVVEELGFGER